MWQLFTVTFLDWWGNPIWSSFIKFDPFWTDLIQKKSKKQPRPIFKMNSGTRFRNTMAFLSVVTMITTIPSSSSLMMLMKSKPARKLYLVSSRKLSRSSRELRKLMLLMIKWRLWMKSGCPFRSFRAIWRSGRRKDPNSSPRLTLWSRQTVRLLAPNSSRLLGICPSTGVPSLQVPGRSSPRMPRHHR